MHPFSIEVDGISSISQQRLDFSSTEKGEDVDNKEDERLRDKDKGKAKPKKVKKNKRPLNDNENYKKEKRRVRFANR